MVRTTLDGVTKPWVVFVESIVAREHMPTWDCLWDDFIQEETCRGYWAVHLVARRMRRMWL